MTRLDEWWEAFLFSWEEIGMAYLFDRAFGRNPLVDKFRK